MIADVTGAFLYGLMTRTVFIELPPELGGNGPMVGLLRKSLYGLRDAPLIWKRHLTGTLLTHGFQESPTMPGLLKHTERELKISVHVDDVLITGVETDLDWLQYMLNSAYQMKFQRVGHNHDLEASYLNRTLRWTTEGIEWCPHPRHVKTILRDLGLETASAVSTPLTGDLLTPSTAKEMDEKAARNYRAVAARINYLAQDRPDLAVASCVAASRMSAPRDGDDANLTRIG